MNKIIALASIAAGLCLIGTHSASAQNLVVNGTFDVNLDGWENLTAVVDPNDPTTVTYNGTMGSPGGAALFARNTVLPTFASNGNHLRQVIPVEVGVDYKFDADWKGDLLAGNTGRNFAEVFVAFTDTPEVEMGLGTGDLMYKKRVGGTPGSSEGNLNIDPPASGAIWDWESVLGNPDLNGTIEKGPRDGIFTATGAFMLIAFNLGGRSGDDQAGPASILIDNVSVTAATDIDGDFDHDEDVDGNDLLEWQRIDNTPAGLLEWKTAFEANALSAVGSVPEPSSALMIGLSMLVALSRRRR